MKTALVIADTRLPPRRLWQRFLDAADLVVAADGGADRAAAADVAVHWIVGDLDGVRPATLSRMPKSRIRKIDDPYSTDLEKVMQFLETRKVRRVIIIGAIGGRLDHTLGTLAVVAEWGKRFEVVVVDDHFTTTLVKGTAKVEAPAGTMVSLVSPGGARGVSTQGMRWDLTDATLPFSSLGIHNEVRESPATVRVRSGTLFLLRAHYVKRHR